MLLQRPMILDLSFWLNGNEFMGLKMVDP
jgi:hypothetical protein